MHRLADRERALAPGQCSLGEVRMNRKVVHGFFVLAVAITSCDSRDCDCDTAAANVRLVRRSVELGYNNRDPEFFDSAYHADAVVWNNGVLLDDGPILDGFRADLAAYDQMFSAWRIEVNDIFGTADRVAVRWTFHGRLRDSGHDVTQTGNWIARFDGGKIVEVWEATQEPDAPPP